MSAEGRTAAVCAYEGKMYNSPILAHFLCMHIYCFQTITLSPITRPFSPAYSTTIAFKSYMPPQLSHKECFLLYLFNLWLLHASCKWIHINSCIRT